MPAPLDRSLQTDARAKPALLMVGAAESSSYVKAGSASGSGVDGSRRGSIARKAR
jgi:hypothetical protein